MGRVKINTGLIVMVCFPYIAITICINLTMLWHVDPLIQIAIITGMLIVYIFLLPFCTVTAYKEFNRRVSYFTGARWTNGDDGHCI